MTHHKTENSCSINFYFYLLTVSSSKRASVVSANSSLVGRVAVYRSSSSMYEKINMAMHEFISSLNNLTVKVPHNKKNVVPPEALPKMFP